ncbi:uncharacterized protein PG986_000655 [Apiospora aurea]|uniref:Uncharacterized protein n=1 Tax=Apiospora aurea TaxID=335848 RepID=A0ABR1QV98_9PEZI
MAGNRPRRPSLREHFQTVRSFLTPNAAEEYVNELVAEEVQRSHSTAWVAGGSSRNSANTPFGFEIPSIGYALAFRQEPKTVPKPIFKASGAGGNTWLGAPALLSAKDDPRRPETVAKVLDGIRRPWTEGKHPQKVLGEGVPFDCLCGLGVPGLYKCETCGRPYRTSATECEDSKAQKRDPQKRTRRAG